jgi:hypothetical protein
MHLESYGVFNIVKIKDKKWKKVLIRRFQKSTVTDLV